MSKDDILISAVTPDMVPLVWHTVEPMIAAAIDHSNGELSIDSIFERLKKKEMILLIATEGERVMAALTVEKREFDTGKSILNITTAGGQDLYLWMGQLDPIMDKLAIEHNCDEVYIVGRPGWMRMLKDLGYEKVHTVVSKKVGG